MTKSVNYEYEAKPNSQGEFECVSYSSVEREYHRDFDQANDEQQHNKHFQYSHFDPRSADEVFKRSYQSNFFTGNSAYVDKMRMEFDQMRQSMLDQMESFTFIKNIKR